MSRGLHVSSNPRWVLLLLFLGYATLAFAVLGANPFKHESITPLDVLVKQRAWNWVDPSVKVRQPERTDIINGLLPSWIVARNQIRDGHLPLWNDQYAGGSTLLVANNSMYTPGFLVFAATSRPALGFHLAIVLNLAIAGLGMHLFLRRRLSLPAAIFGAITFEFCGFHAAWLYWPHVFTLIWAPWLLLAIDRCARMPGFRHALPIAAASALLILGGFPFVAELVFGMAALYFVVLWAGNHPAGWRGRFALWSGAGICLGFLLCALPLLELMQFLQQYDLGYRSNRGSHLKLSYITRLLPPWSYDHMRVEQTMYVGLAMFLLAMVAAMATLLRWRRSTDLARFGTLLLAIMCVVVFGLIPVSLLAWFPGMGFNSWSRGIGVLDIALIVLGSLAVDHAWKATRMVSHARLLGAGIGLLVLVQAVEIMFFFSHYNGPVSDRYFYPRTPATDYLRKHAGPFDYIIADDSFHISGALGAYGLREWFGHQFRTPALQAALIDMVPRHFSSYTSSRFKAQDIRVDSPLMATMNVRYLAVSSATPPGAGPIAKRPGKHWPLPPLPAHHWLQKFSLERPTALEAVSVRLATYRRSDLKGEVRLTLSDAAGNVLETAALDAATVVDNAMADFNFPHPVMLDNGTYGFALAFISPAGSEPLRLTAWATEAPAQETGLRVDGMDANGAVEYLLHAGTGSRGPFRRVLKQAGISVYENNNSPGGPYFVARLDATPNARSGQHVRIEQYTPNRFVMRYSGSEPGFVVVPMSMSNEWVAVVNNAIVKPGAMLGIMPAVRVQGPAKITFEYRPLASRLFVAWLVALLAALLTMFLIDRRTGSSRKAGGKAT